MRRYWFELTDEHYQVLGASIPDGSNKQSAINRAKRWMKGNGIGKACLAVNSMVTNNLIDIVDIELN
ncbi:MAG: hypothetical protein ACI30I_06230 [Parabacteroides sp.]